MCYYMLLEQCVITVPSSGQLQRPQLETCSAGLLQSTGTGGVVCYLLSPPRQPGDSFKRQDPIRDPSLHTATILLTEPATTN